MASLGVWIGGKRQGAKSRAWWIVGLPALVAVALLMLLPIAASAQAQPAPTAAPTPCNSQQCITTAVNGAIGANPGSANGVKALGWFDPSSQIAQIAANWFPQAQGMARTLYGLLFIIELFMLGLQTVLFRDNLGEFFSTIAFKAFVAGFFIWLISDASDLFTAIIGSFNQAGQMVSGAGKNTLSTLYGEEVGAVLLFATAAGAALAGAAGASDVCFIDSGCATAVSTVAQPIAIICAAMAILVFSSLLVLSLMYTLLAIESVIVMCAGVFFLGFAGTRFTMPFSQGYLRYAVNVGVKLFAFWLVIAIEEPMMKGVLGNAGLTAGASIIGAVAAAVGGAAGGGIAVVAGVSAVMFAAMGALQVIVLNALATAVPTLAGSLTSGSSLFSAQETLKGVGAAFAEAGISMNAAALKMNSLFNGLKDSPGKIAAQSGRAFDDDSKRYRETGDFALPVAGPFLAANLTSSQSTGQSETPAPLGSGITTSMRRPTPASSQQSPASSTAPRFQGPPGGNWDAVTNGWLDQFSETAKEEREKSQQRYGLGGMSREQFAGLSLPKFAKLLQSDDPLHFISKENRDWIKHGVHDDYGFPMESVERIETRRKIAAALLRQKRYARQKSESLANFGRGFVALEALQVSTHSGKDSNAPGFGDAGIK